MPKSYNKSSRESPAWHLSRPAESFYRGHAPIPRTMSQTSLNEDAATAPGIAASAAPTRPAAAKAPDAKPKKRRPKRLRYGGDDMSVLTVRIPERERALCYADATETIRTINAHIVHRLKHVVAEKGGPVRAKDVGAFLEVHGQGLGERFVLRLPTWLAEDAKAVATREGVSINSLVRYSLFEYPAPPSDTLPYRVRVYRGPSETLVQPNPPRGPKHSTYSGTPAEAYRSFRLPGDLLAKLGHTADVLDRSVNGQLIVATRNCLAMLKSKEITMEDLLGLESLAMTSTTGNIAAQLRDQQPVIDALDRVVTRAKRAKKPPYVVMSCMLEIYFQRFGHLSEG